jgi:hypothetical protein
MKNEPDFTHYFASMIASGFEPDPGTSDLDDEQPIIVRMPLGAYRTARRIRDEANEKMRAVLRSNHASP